MDDCERALIACILISTERIGDIYGLLTSKMFSNPILGKVYDRAVQCYDANKKADITILANGDDTITAELVNIITSPQEASPGNIKIYAGMVAKGYRARMLRGVLKQINPDPAKIDHQLAELAQVIESLDNFSSSAENISSVVDRYKAELFTSGRGIRLGYTRLDGILGGLQKGNVCIIAARPSVGKSAFSTEIAINMAKSGKRIGLYNLEMTNKEVYRRMIAHESGVNMNSLGLNTREQIEFDKGNESLKKLSIFMADDLKTVSAMQGDMKRNRVDIGIIDYAQLIRPERRYSNNRTAEVGQISHQIKWAAKSLNIPIILLAQLNRASMMTRTKEPSMAELRESGDFEQDADKIVLMWNKEGSRTIKGVKVEKNRQGRTGKVEMRFDGTVMQFREAGGREPTPFDEK